MPARNFLSEDQVKRLQNELRTSELGYVRERVLILLLQNTGKTQPEIAEFIGCSPRTVAYWSLHGDPNNLESLHNKREEEHHRKATPEYIQKLMETTEKDPSELGYEFGRWTTERLSTYLEKETGIKISGSQIRRILKAKKYRYIWGKYILEDKQDVAKREDFKKRLAIHLGLAKKDPKYIQIWFWDESGFSMRVIRRKNWGKKGKRKHLTGQRRKGHINVMGCIRESDRKRICFFVKKGNGDIFYEQLHQLVENLKQEWIEQSHAPEDFKKVKIVIVLDNASYHKRKDVIQKVKSDLPNIILEFLPPYSPDLNIIELVWHSCKEYIAHRLFKSTDELKELLNKLLNEGELIIKWNRKIKNKGNNCDIAT
jgi:transposase